MTRFTKENREIRLLRRNLYRVSQTLETLQSLQDTSTQLQNAMMEELDQEKQRSEKLLLNILPRHVINQLGQGSEPIADEHPCVSVIFSDFIGFTGISQQLTANQLVEILNKFFARFDANTISLAVEKIKTIGDAYMAVTGLNGNTDHAVRAVEFGLQMVDVVKEVGQSLDQDWAIRVGIHSGPVTAGVIGTAKFAYDIWGDTVNTASRLESSGEAGRVHVSSATADLLGDRFKQISRGAVELKGKGKMQTCFVDLKTP